MSDVNDEIFKIKYLKYKNKYLNLKEQYAGTIFNEKVTIIFYKEQFFPGLKDYKNLYSDAINSDNFATESTLKTNMQKILMLDKKYNFKDLNGILNLNINLNRLETVAESNILNTSILNPFIFSLNIITKPIKSIKLTPLIFFNINDIKKVDYLKKKSTDIIKEIIKMYNNIKKSTIIIENSIIQSVFPILCENINKSCEKILKYIKEDSKGSYKNFLKDVINLYIYIHNNISFIDFSSRNLLVLKYFITFFKDNNIISTTGNIIDDLKPITPINTISTDKLKEKINNIYLDSYILVSSLNTKQTINFKVENIGSKEPIKY
jgi:hypothetical protein